MKKITNFAIILFLIFFGSCQKKQVSTNCFEYPKQIDSLKIQDLYDTARLYIFTWVCDRKIDSYYRGEFELKYKYFFLRNDSLELFFSHSLPKELQNSESDKNTHQTSIAFNIRTKQKLWGWDINGFSNRLNKGDDRFERPDSPEVLDFIKTHKQILNPCFLELAKKKNLL